MYQIAALGLVGVGGAIALHVIAGWPWIAIIIMGLTVPAVSAGLVVLAASRPDPEQMPMAWPTQDEATWERYARNCPKAWQFCSCVGTRIVHRWDASSKGWCCMNCGEKH